ncbi:MAG: FtsX-like permease family protein [Bifidobacteriaceae bacterium]|nr:FtsX-like permease family protein [Bifidobacteriaceae bacterium]
MPITRFLVQKDLRQELALSTAVALLACLFTVVVATAVGANLSNQASYDDVYSRVIGASGILKFTGTEAADSAVAGLLEDPDVAKVEHYEILSGLAVTGDRQIAVGLVAWSDIDEDLALNESSLEGSNSVVLPDVVASVLGAAVGDRISLECGASATDLEVVGTYDDPVFGSPIMGFKRLVVSSSAFDTVSLAAAEYPGSKGEVVSFTVNSGSELQASSIIANLEPARTADFAYDSEFVRKAYTMIPGIITAILTFVSLATSFVLALVLRHLTRVMVQREWKASGILKSLGMTTRQLRSRLTLRLVAVGATGAVAGSIVAAVAIRQVAAIYLRSNGLSDPPRIISWPAVAAALLIILFIGIVAHLGSRSLRRSSPRDAVVASSPGGSRRLRKGVPLERLAGLPLSLALGVKDVIKSPARYTSLLSSALVFSFLSVVLVTLANSLDSQSTVSRLLGLNTYDVSVLVTLPSAVADEAFKNAQDSLPDSEHVQFVSSMQQANIVTAERMFVATISEAVPSTQEVSEGRRPKAPDEVMLGSALARDLGLAVGSTVILSGQTTADSQAFTVTGVYETVNQTGLTLWLLDDGYLRLNPSYVARTYVIDFDDGVTDAQVDAAIDALNGYSGVVAATGRAQVSALITTIQASLRAVMVIVLMTGWITAAVVSLLLTVTTIAVEARDIVVMNALGFSDRASRRQLLMRFLTATVVASALGATLAGVLGSGLLGGILSAAGLGAIRHDTSWPAAVGVCVAFALVSALSVRLAANRFAGVTAAALADE